jgi:hypothetical protein
MIIQIHVIDLIHATEKIVDMMHGFDRGHDSDSAHSHDMQHMCTNIGVSHVVGHSCMCEADHVNIVLSSTFTPARSSKYDAQNTN